MAEVTTELIKRVRQLTGAGMSAVKKALVDASGDVDKAVETLRLKGAKDVGKRAQRTCLLYTSPSPRDRSVSRMPSSA